MRDWLEVHKLAASARSHLLLAAAMWSVVGALLLACGANWLLSAQIHYAWGLFVVAVAIGLIKARFVLGRAARRTIDRILVRGDGRCIGGFFSLKTWALVLVMACAGRLLRGGLVPRPVVGFIYAAVGTALLLATLVLWRAWFARAADA